MVTTGYDIYCMRREIGYTKIKVEKESGISRITLIRWENRNKKEIAGKRNQYLKLFKIFYFVKSIKDDLQLANKIREIFKE